MNLHIAMPLQAAVHPTPSDDNGRFAVGDRVDHVDGGMLGFIRCGSVTAGGTEVYWVELLEENERPLRVMRGDFLRPAE